MFVAVQTRMYSEVMSPQTLLSETQGQVSVVDGYLYIMDYGHDDHKAVVRSIGGRGVCCCSVRQPFFLPPQVVHCHTRVCGCGRVVMLDVLDTLCLYCNLL